MLRCGHAWLLYSQKKALRLLRLHLLHLLDEGEGQYLLHLLHLLGEGELVGEVED